MNVVVVESPSKAKTINKYLGNDYTVLASFGHVRDLPSKDGSVRPDDDFAMTYEIDADSKKHVSAIIKAQKGADALYAMLVERDPDAAKTMHANNVPYVVRALEIVESQGKKISKKASEGGVSPYNVFMLGIEWPRDKLCERIDARVDIQMSRGLMEESRTLLSKYDVKLPSRSSLGAKEFDPYFKGKITLEEVAKKLKSNTRRYAKRQMTWFKKEPDVYWISGEELERQPEKLTEQIIRDIMAAL